MSIDKHAVIAAIGHGTEDGADFDRMAVDLVRQAEAQGFDAHQVVGHLLVAIATRLEREGKDFNELLAEYLQEPGA